MRKRRVTSPDGTKWIVGRRWLLHRPRYFGFRFGIKKREPYHEPPVYRPTVERKPGPTRPPTPPVVRYQAQGKKPRKRRTESSGGSGSSGRRSSGGSGGWWIFTGGGRSGSGGRSSGGLFRSSGGGSRGSSGGGSRGSSGGGKRGGGGGGGGAGAAGALLTALIQVLKYIAIALAVIVAILFVVFVLVPTLVFLVQYLAFWVVVGVTMLYRALSGRPWIVEMEEADGYRVHSWRVLGWDESKVVIDEIAEAIRGGKDPAPSGAEPVEIVNAPS